MALVLTVKSGEVVHIGKQTKVQVRKANGADRFLLIIDAPRSIPVVRDELLAKSTEAKA